MDQATHLAALVAAASRLWLVAARLVLAKEWSRSSQKKRQRNYGCPMTTFKISDRIIPNSKLYRSWCGICGCSMRVSEVTLREEMRGHQPECIDCTEVRPQKSYRGSSIEFSDIRYHGGMFHRGEW